MKIFALSAYLVDCGYTYSGNNRHPSYNASDKIIVGYYADWTRWGYPLENIPIDKLTHINYAFAVLNSTYDIAFDSQDNLKKVREMSKAKNVKLLLSIGGWTGSRYFSSMLKNDQLRARFVTQCLQILKEFELDGIDVDYEYPGKMGMSCNEVDYKHDTPNYMKLTRELRTALGQKLLTMAVATHTFDVDQKHLTDMSELASLVDYVMIMAYDINSGPTPVSGPNGPLEYERGKGGQQSYMQSIEDWCSAGMPKNKIVMGMAFYGKSRKFKTSFDKKEGVYQQVEAEMPQGDEDDSPWAEPCPGAKPVLSGNWKWKKLRSQGVLTEPTKAGTNWTRYWDQVSQTPYLVNEKTDIIVLYDDPESLGIKADVVMLMDLKGAMYWSIDMDNNELLDSITKIRK